jgi:hypothetical protein
MHEVSDGQVEALVSALGNSSLIDAGNRSLLVYEQGGNPRHFYVDLPLGHDNPLLFVGSPLWFPLTLLPSHYGLIGVRQASLLGPTFDLVATQNMTSIIYAPRGFETAFLARLRRLVPWFSSFGFDDLLATCGDDWFVVHIYQGYEHPFMEAKVGSGVAAGIFDLLGTFRVAPSDR